MAGDDHHGLRDVLRRAAGLETRSAPTGTLARLVPEVPALAGLPRGTPVWIRLDLDTPAKDFALSSDARVASAMPILAEGRRRGWRMLLLAHRGSDAAGTLRDVHGYLCGALPGRVVFVRDWFDEEADRFTAAALSAVRRTGPGDVVLFENTRKYEFEMRLRGAREEDLPHLATGFHRLAAAFAGLADVYVNDAFATCNENFTTAVLPLAMVQVAAGPFLWRELLEHAEAVSHATLLCCAGAKWNKLGYLLGILEHGGVEVASVGGRLAVAFLEAAAVPGHEDERSGVPGHVVGTAARVLAAATASGTRLVLPTDWVLEDGTVVEDLATDAWPQDVGPRSRRRFEAEAQEWLHRTSTPVVYANGVMGRFEDPRWCAGTRAMVETLVGLQRSGASVYVGGGEGRSAVERYARAGDVSHAFTAGGTLLRILGGRPLPFLEALAARAAHDGPLLG